MERVVFLCVLAVSMAGNAANSDKVLSRHKRWLWGGCGLIPYCDKCLNSLQCVQCQEGYIFMEYPSMTPSRVVRCTKACPKGYKIKTIPNTGSSCVYTDKVCIVAHCSACHPRRTHSCNKCSKGFYLLRPSVRENGKCVRRCPSWYRPTTTNDDIKECKLRGTECRARVPNCDRCLDKIWCRRCKKGHLTFFNRSDFTMDCVVKCPPKYEEVKSEYFGQYCQKREVKKKCQAITNCRYCPNNVSCKRCAKNFLKLKSSVFGETTCVKVCPKRYKERGRRCRPVRKRGCVDDFCTTCKVGLYRMSRRLCRRRCPKGHYKVGTVRKLCLKCPYRCQRCSSLFHCLKCAKGFAKAKNKQGIICMDQCPPGHREVKNRRHVRICQSVV